MLTTFARFYIRKSYSSYYQCCSLAQHAAVSGTIVADTILSDENRKRCIQCMQKAVPIGIKFKTPSKDQQSFAAVLIAICSYDSGEISILFTRRSGIISRHVRQISFPGGIKDANDVDFVDCALRETEEEIGLPRARIEIWGTGSLITPPHTAAIRPVIGVVHNLDIGELKLNADEVDEAFTIPISQLAHPSSLYYTQFKSGYSAPQFVVGPYKVWGITGFMTNNFLSCLLPLEANVATKRVRFIRPFKQQINEF